MKWNGADRADAGVGSEPLRWKSTAFNLDYALATIRYYFDGRCDWCSAGYAAGQAWESIGAWFNPYPWGNSGQRDYMESVKRHLAERTWENEGF